MAKNERTSSKIASWAAKGLKDPDLLTKSQTKSVFASVLTQAPDRR